MTAAPITAAFDLVDHYGNPVTERTYRGRHVLVFFGFTHCRMVCPRALGRLSEALADLGVEADQFQPLYISVDPERDRPETMREFLREDYPRFIGLTGTVEQAAATREAFGVFTRRAADPVNPDGYAVPHTAITYVLDREGEYVAHLTDALQPAQIRDRLRALLR